MASVFHDNPILQKWRVGLWRVIWGIRTSSDDIKARYALQSDNCLHTPEVLECVRIGQSIHILHSDDVWVLALTDDGNFSQSTERVSGCVEDTTHHLCGHPTERMQCVNFLIYIF